MLLCCIIPSCSGKNQHSAQEVARRISGAVAGESTQKLTYQVPIRTLISHITLFAICLSFSSPSLHPCRFIRPLSLSILPLYLPLLPVCFLCPILFAVIIMDSSSSIACTPENEVLNFKQRGGENLKDAWYRICNLIVISP